MKAILSLVFFPCLCALGAEATKIQYDLDAVKYADRLALPEGAKALLGKQGFVVAGMQFKQIFQAYIGGPLPPFITVDSAWHTYHVLLEEGVRQMEESQATRLQAFSRGLMDVAKKKAKAGRAYGDILLLAAVGLGLQDPEGLKALPPGDRATAEEILKKLKGSSPVPVPFLGLPLSAERFQATSFYAKSPKLRGYFSARQWYALCDFRAVSPRETELAFRLALLVNGNPALKKGFQDLTDSYDGLLAKAEDGDVASYLDIAKKSLGSELAEERLEKNVPLLQEAIQRILPDPKVNDQLLQPDEYLEFPRLTKGFRLLPPRQIPSAVVFQKTVDPAIPNRMFPSGLDFVASGPLASAASKRALQLEEKDASTVQAILKIPPQPFPESLHGQALNLFTLLQKPLPESAPSPLKTPAWQDKQLWTQLASWAEQRHTWALHAKLTVHYAGISKNEPGVVSPYPEFFARLGKLSMDTARILGKFTVEEAIDTKAVAKKLLRVLDIMKRLRAEREDKNTKRPTDEEFMELEQASDFFQAYFSEGQIGSSKELETSLQVLEKLARTWADGAEPSLRQKEALKLLGGKPGKVTPLLRQFALLCNRLEGLARKLLEGKKLTGEEGWFLRGYGEELAKFHFYGGNSYLSPRDDFPICTPIFSSPIQQKILYAGIARPEALYVVIKVNGQDVLHRGAVLSYREFRRDSRSVLTDDDWQIQVQAGKCPPPPAFTGSFRVPGEFLLAEH